jgi:hypothetical protein
MSEKAVGNRGWEKERKKEEREEEEGTELDESQRLNWLIVPSFSPQSNQWRISIVIITGSGDGHHISYSILLPGLPHRHRHRHRQFAMDERGIERGRLSSKYQLG